MIVRLNESYEAADDMVTITVEVGNGQKGHNTVYIDSDKRVSGSKITGEPLGNGAELRGKEIRVSSTVTDTNQNTNRTSVTYTLKGGKQDRVYALAYTVESERETVGYYAKFKVL